MWGSGTEWGGFGLGWLVSGGVGFGGVWCRAVGGGGEWGGGGGGVVNIIYIIFHVEFLDVRDKSNSQTNDGLHLL